MSQDLRVWLCLLFRTISQGILSSMIHNNITLLFSDLSGQKPYFLRCMLLKLLYWGNFPVLSCFWLIQFCVLLGKTMLIVTYWFRRFLAVAAYQVCLHWLFNVLLQIRCMYNLMLKGREDSPLRMKLEQSWTRVVRAHHHSEITTGPRLLPSQLCFLSFFSFSMFYPFRHSNASLF